MNEKRRQREMQSYSSKDTVFTAKFFNAVRVGSIAKVEELLSKDAQSQTKLGSRTVAPHSLKHAHTIT